MNNSSAFIFFALILLFSNAVFAARIRSTPYESSDDDLLRSKYYMALPTDLDLAWLQNAQPSSFYQEPDQRLRRGWGGGRRR